jgi:hypothetical protein
MSKVSINYDGMIPVHIRAQHPQHKIAHFRPNQRNECDLVTVTKDGNPLEGLARRLKEIWRLEDKNLIIETKLERRSCFTGLRCGDCTDRPWRMSRSLLLTRGLPNRVALQPEFPNPTSGDSQILVVLFSSVAVSLWRIIKPGVHSSTVSRLRKSTRLAERPRALNS